MGRRIRESGIGSKKDAEIGGILLVGTGRDLSLPAGFLSEDPTSYPYHQDFIRNIRDLSLPSKFHTKHPRPVPTIRIAYGTYAIRHNITMPKKKSATRPHIILIGKSVPHPNIRIPYLSITLENIIPMLHHRKRNRLRGFNYAQDRLYFITSCVHNRVCVFGEVIANQMILNECGLIADRQWQWMENQYPYVRMHTHIVMPNHVHAIIEINRELIHDVGTGRDMSLHHGRDLSVPDIKIKPLSELIGAYKTTSSKKIHLIQALDGSYTYQSFCWQRSFHDRIIRNQKEYERIVTYIDQNPLSWSQDEFYR